MSIAVLLATYNSEQYLEELLESLLRQTLKNFVCYIHDDGSTDSTMDIIDKYRRKHTDIIRVLYYPSTGSAKANFLSMLNYVDEDYVMFCDHDDVWMEDKIEKSYNYIRKIEKDVPTLVFSDMKVTDRQLNVIDSSFMHHTGLNPYNTSINSLLVENVVPGCTSILNRKLYRIVRKCSDVNNIRMHDQWCALVAAAAGKIEFLDESLLLYRQHNNNVKGANKEKGIIKKVNDIAKRMITLRFVEDNREWHEMMGKQAHEVALLEEVQGNSKCLCEGFYNLREKGKFERIHYYISNNIHRGKDNLWLLLWC